MGPGSGGVERDTRVLRRRTPEVIVLRMAISRDATIQLTGNYSHGTLPIFQTWLPEGITLSSSLHPPQTYTITYPTNQARISR